MRLLALAALLLTTQLGGCFFVFIPGSLIQKASDSITGAEGEHCVNSAASVGDSIMLTSGKTATVQSLSGASIRCKDERFPVRARLEVARDPV